MTIDREDELHELTSDQLYSVSGGFIWFELGTHDFEIKDQRFNPQPGSDPAGLRREAASVAGLVLVHIGLPKWQRQRIAASRQHLIHRTHVPDTLRWARRQRRGRLGFEA